MKHKSFARVFSTVTGLLALVLVVLAIWNSDNVWKWVVSAIIFLLASLVSYAVADMNEKSGK